MFGTGATAVCGIVAAEIANIDVPYATAGTTIAAYSGQSRRRGGCVRIKYMQWRK